MSDNNFNQFILKKAYEISYALFRMAAVVQRPSFADDMESRGLLLLDAAVADDHEKAGVVARSIEYLLRFGADVGVLSRANVEIVARELAVFNSAIAELKKSASNLPNAELSDVFSKLPLPAAQNMDSFKTSAENEQSKLSFTSEQEQKEEVIIHKELADGPNNNGNHSLLRSAMRQSAILERIRQNGSCRLKDIQEFLPESSERTLRYDVQNLIGQGLIERVGSGGPATYYKIREIAALSEGR